MSMEVKKVFIKEHVCILGLDGVRNLLKIRTSKIIKSQKGETSRI